MKFKKFIILTLVFLLSIIAAACGNDNNSTNNNDETNTSGETNGEETLAADQTLTVNISTEPPSLHPGLVTDTTSVSIVNQTFEGLMRINKDGELENAMAESYEVSDDQLVYTFKIREDATWSNQEPVTAHDFEYAWKWVLNPENVDANYAYQLYPIKGAQQAKEEGASINDIGVVAEDDETLVVELNEPTPYFLELVAFPTYFPVNKNVAEENEDWAVSAGEDYVTNGPFLMEEWNHKSDIVLKKNEDYWDADKVKLETINMLMIGDENTALNMFDSGELDWIGQPLDKVPFAAVDSMNDAGKLNKVTSAALYYYVINTEEEPFNNKNIRKALALSIDRKGIVENITKKGEEPATAFVPPTLFTENESGYFADNDVEQAKEYLQKGLEELGLDELPTFSLSYNTDDSHATIAEAIQDMWRKNLGLDVELDNEEWGVYLNSLSEGDFQVGRYGWGADYMDAVSFLEVYENKGGNNSTNWENSEYQELIKASRTETDSEKRYEILRDAEAIFMDEMPIIPIYYEVLTWANNENLRDVNVTTLALVQFKEAYFVEE